MPGTLLELPWDLVAEGLAVARYVLQKDIVTALGFLFSYLLPGRTPWTEPTSSLPCGTATFLPDLPLRANLVEPPADWLGLRSGWAVGRRG